MERSIAITEDQFNVLNTDRLNVQAAQQTLDTRLAGIAAGKLPDGPFQFKLGASKKHGHTLVIIMPDPPKPEKKAGGK